MRLLILLLLLIMLLLLLLLFSGSGDWSSRRHKHLERRCSWHSKSRRRSRKIRHGDRLLNGPRITECVYIAPLIAISSSANSRKVGNANRRSNDSSRSSGRSSNGSNRI